MKRHLFNYTVEELIPYIDWNYFFHAWCIDSRNEKAEEIKRDAEALLQKTKHKITAKALFALCNARGVSDSIIAENTTLPLLRQQHARKGEPNLCLSDFIAPQGDKIGLFATAVKEIPHSNDTYEKLLAQTIESRLAEAAATLLHKEVRTRKELWGYATDEQLTTEELKTEKNQGIRPAVGYPSLPDQSIIFIIDKLLHLQEIGITLTPNGAMQPAASVCGIMISHPAAHYFNVGEISEEQLLDYAKRRDIKSDNLHKFLYKNLHK